MSRYTKAKAAETKARLMDPPPISGPVPDEIRPKQELVKGSRPKPLYQRLVLTAERPCHECRRVMPKGEVAVVSKRGGERFRCRLCQPSVWRV